MDKRVLVLITIILYVCCRVDGNCDRFPMKPCNPHACVTERRPCPAAYCQFCKRDERGIYKCHQARHIKSNDDIKRFIANFEDCRLHLYQSLIGYGFNAIQAGALRKFFYALPLVEHTKVASGVQNLTEEQAWKLFCYCIDETIATAKGLIGDVLYNTLSWKMKAAIVNAIFRGELTAETVALIKAGKWEEVWKEYLDNDRYRASKAKGSDDGLWKRMECNAWLLGKLRCPKKD